MVFLQAIAPCIQGLEAESWRDFTTLPNAHPVRWTLAKSSESATILTEVALEVGYESPRAFIAIFKRTLGITPYRYFACSSAITESSG